ncbi:MAG: 30S ribosomal protein S7 [Bacteroidetes bacterium]|nr:30S ribosomal protein S7 [Rhodothermia bacterium]MCS7154539.1 30S ribosomal protein S7 [Bacteroidota bacterium]MCX7906256.1 30S ribosomal protein S7 [Bacteroidota bacterium]MDW8137332.1 30S ribosomal protein S7 [Bacteroidota bacterium]MDW8285714.1 30S ribosomal protein S7 [Bacteroidota bacterium]
MRRKRAERRPIAPDLRYNDVLVAKFINHVMRKGKKNLARRIVYGAFDIIAERTGENPLDVFRRALDNVAPVVEVRSRRVGGATYQVPVEVRPERRISLAMRWIIEYAKQRRAQKTMELRLASELLDAAKGQGSAVKKRDDTHRMAEANKAFAHFRF